MVAKLRLPAAAVLAVMVLAGGVANAHVANIGTSLGVQKSPKRAVQPRARVLIFGMLKSPNDDCVANQQVKLFRRRPGPDRLMGTTVTDGEGEYVFRRRFPTSRTVYTRFQGDVESSYGHSHTCQPDRSRNLRIRVR
jgi:hypothetical protein